MRGKPHFFLGLAAEADARNCLRKSLLIEASNFLVGTLSSVAFRLSRFSMRGAL